MGLYIGGKNTKKNTQKTQKKNQKNENDSPNVFGVAQQVDVFGGVKGEQKAVEPCTEFDQGVKHRGIDQGRVGLFKTTQQVRGVRRPRQRHFVQRRACHGGQPAERGGFAACGGADLESG